MKGSENFNWRPVKPRLQANRSLLTWSSDLLTHGLVTFGFDTRCQSPHLGNLHHFLDCLGLGRPSMIFATHMNINIYIFKHNHFCLLCHSGRSFEMFYFTVQWEFFLFLFYFICFVVVVSIFTFQSLKHDTIPRFLAGSFAVHPGYHLRFWDHWRSNLGIICAGGSFCGLGGICGTVQFYISMSVFAFQCLSILNMQLQVVFFTGGMQITVFTVIHKYTFSALLCCV